jgi:hypothetical protein
MFCLSITWSYFSHQTFLCFPAIKKGVGAFSIKGGISKKYFSKNGEALRDGARIIRFRASKRLGVKRD